jgi:DNA-binding NarL/FixJ family response regulator
MTATMPFDVVVVESRTWFRHRVRTTIERGGDFRVVGEAENVTDAVQLCSRMSPHIVLVDIGRPGANGTETLTELQRHCPAVQVVILSKGLNEKTIHELSDATSLVTLANQRLPQNQWRIHPIIDGCQPVVIV